MSSQASLACGINELYIVSMLRREIDHINWILRPQNHRQLVTPFAPKHCVVPVMRLVCFMWTVILDDPESVCNYSVRI